MAEENVNRQTRMRLPVGFRGPQATELKTAETKGRKTAEDLYNTLVRNAEMMGAAAVTRILSGGEAVKEGAGGKEAGEPRSPVRPFEEVVEAAKLFGINFSELVASKDAALKAAKEAQTTAEKELYEMRAARLQEMIDGVKTLVAEVTAKRGQEGDGDLGTTLGLGKLDPEVKKKVQERALGLTPPRGEGGETVTAREPAPFTRDWFNQWNEMKPGIEAFARMLGFVPKEEARGGDTHEPLVSLKDLADGDQVPVALALGIRKLELEHKREELRIEREDKRESRRLEILGDMSQTLKANLPDALAALRDVAGQHNVAAASQSPEGAPTSQNPEGAPKEEEPVFKRFRCGKCGYHFAVAEEREKYTCPSCGEPLETARGPA